MPRSAPPLFAVEGLRCFEVRADDIPELQRFFGANPEYFVAVTGQPPGATEADEEYRAGPPEGWSHGKKWLLGFGNDADLFVGMANIVSDLLAPGVWHIGLFIIATSRHGTGDAQALHRGIESWAASRGAKWLRLGVVHGNVRAERFWEALGYVEARTRQGVELGRLVSTVRVMVKPLAGGTLAQYLTLVGRDRPDPADAP